MLLQLIKQMYFCPLILNDEIIFFEKNKKILEKNWSLKIYVLVLHSQIIKEVF